MLLPPPAVKPLVLVVSALAALALLIHLVSPSDSAGARPAAERKPVELEPLPNARVGKVEGSRALIALSLDGRRLRAYLCDGTIERRPTISKWLEGRWDGRSKLTLTRDGVELRIERVGDDGAVTGHVTIAGVRHAFGVERTRRGGLFDRIDPRNHFRRTTWIVADDQRLRGTFSPPRKPKQCYVIVTGSSPGDRIVVCG